MDLGKLFENVSTLPGVEGVCLIDPDGELRVDRMPAFLAGAPLAEARARIQRLYETMDARALAVDDYVLRFAEHRLLLRRSENFVLVVLAGESASLSGLRMVTNILLKNITGPALDALAATTPAPPPQPAPAQDPPRSVRMYRGRPY